MLKETTWGRYWTIESILGKETSNEIYELCITTYPLSKLYIWYKRVKKKQSYFYSLLYFRVLQLMNLTDSRLSQNGCEKLDLAILSFFEQFRKIYVGDQVQKSSKVSIMIEQIGGWKKSVQVLLNKGTDRFLSHSLVENKKLKAICPSESCLWSKHKIKMIRLKWLFC